MGVVAPCRCGPTPTASRPRWSTRSRGHGRGVLLQPPVQRDEVIEDYGERAPATGELILYTSQDSVLQLAAHVDVVPLDELTRRARGARGHAGRARRRPRHRPAVRGAPGAFVRTDGRKDFSSSRRAVLPRRVQAAGVPVHAVGKVGDLFAGVGIDVEHPGATNARRSRPSTALPRARRGLVFANLVETDQVYGHRQDVPGFARALRDIDGAVAGWLRAAAPRATCSSSPPTTASTRADPHRPHARARAAAGHFAGHGGRRHDGPMADVGASVLRWLRGRERRGCPGTAFVEPSTLRDARAARGRDDPPPPGAPRRGPRAGGARRLDARWCCRSRPESSRRPCRAAGRGAAPARQVPDVGARRRGLPAMHLRMTGTLLLDPPAAPPYARVRFALDDGHDLVFCDPRRFGTGELAVGRAARDAFFAARLGVEPLGAEFTGGPCARRAAARAGQGVPARPAPGRRRREHLRRRGALPRADPSAAPGDRLKGAQFEALRDGVVAALGRDRGEGRVDRRLPRPRRGPGRLPGPIPRAPSRGEPCPGCGRPVGSASPRAAGRTSASAASRARGPAGEARLSGRVPNSASSPRGRPHERVEAADRHAVDDDLGERHHPGSTD